MEVDADSPGTSPPAAKRQKIAEKVDLGFYSFNRDSPELALFKKYYKVCAFQTLQHHDHTYSTELRD